MPRFSRLDLFRFLCTFFPALLLSMALPGLCNAQEKAQEEANEQEKTAWIRMERAEDGKTALGLQTAIVRYRPADGDPNGPTVDLVAAIHVGDKEYYEALNKQFKQYDALLYELVAPKGVKVPKGRGASNGSAIGALQNGMKDLLKLEHQLELVDYTPANFVHADMSPDDFSKKMAERGESFLTMFFRIMGEGMAQQAKNPSKYSDLDVLMAFFSKDRDAKLKAIMAEQFAGMETMMVSLGGPDGSTIITERNKVALEVLGQEVKKGRKKIGIFYGAGHMVDMDERLKKDFNLVPSETIWLTAWDLNSK